MNNLSTEVIAEIKKIRILGFRSNTKWKKFVSIAWFCFCVLYLFGGIFEWKDSITTLWNFFIDKIEILLTTGMLLSPYILLSETPLRNFIPFFRKRQRKYTIIGMIIVVVIFSLLLRVTDALHTKDNAQLDFEIDSVSSQVVEQKEAWSSGKLGKIMPKPDFNNTIAVEDFDGFFEFEAKDITDKQFNEYVEKCKANGFTVNQEQYDGYYSAMNEDNYCITLNYVVDENKVEASIEEITESSTGITDISFEVSEIEIVDGAISQDYEFDVESEEKFKFSDVEFVSENESIAKIQGKEGWLKNSFCVTGTGVGQTFVYLQTKDKILKSDKIKVTIKNNITKIELADEEEKEIYLDDEHEECFDVETQTYVSLGESMFKAVSDNPKVATMSIDMEYGEYYTVTPKKVGETTIYITTADGNICSNKVKVIVKEAEEIEDTDEEYEEEEQEYVAPSQEVYTGPTVYTTPYGKKYHYSSSCAGKNANPRQLEDVQNSYDPCQKCAQ